MNAFLVLRKLFKSIVITLLAVTVASAQIQVDALANRRAQHLRHGINTGMWFAQAPGHYSVERLSTFITTDDLKLIRQMGFDHIRLSIDATPLLEWEHSQPSGIAFMGELDRNVDFALAQGLSVIVDLHPEDAYKQSLLQGSDATDRFAELWVAMAKHYSSRDPEHLFFEILNEPEQTDTFRWQGIESIVGQLIRAVAPGFTLILTGAHYSGLSDLMQLAPVALPNVIYTFHDYEPFPFTHEGATWTLAAIQPLHDVPYPSSPESVAKILPQEPTLAGQLLVEQYGLDRWDAQRIDSTISFAERWSKRYGVPVYCGEFGVFRPFADPAARERWISDMRVSLDQHGIGWAMWEYQTTFGVVVKADGKTTPDGGVLRALGLNANP